MYNTFNLECISFYIAFASGTGDFVQLFEPTASVFEKEGKGHIVASFGTESGHLPYTVYMAKESFLKDDKETVEKFTRALKKAQDWVQENDTAEIAKVIQPFFEDIDVDTMETVIDRYKEQGSFATDPILDEEEWTNLQDIMEEAGELPARISHDELVNTDFAEKVAK